jgi:hypothetical protein
MSKALTGDERRGKICQHSAISFPQVAGRLYVEEADRYPLTALLNAERCQLTTIDRKLALDN